MKQLLCFFLEMVSMLGVGPIRKYSTEYIHNPKKLPIPNPVHLFLWCHKFMHFHRYSLKSRDRKSNQAQSLLELVVIIRQTVFFCHSWFFFVIHGVLLSNFKLNHELKKKHKQFNQFTAQVCQSSAIECAFWRNQIACNLSPMLPKKKKSSAFCARIVIYKCHCSMLGKKKKKFEY